MANVSDVVSKGQNVKVKVLSITGKKVSLSMKVSFAAFHAMSSMSIISYQYLYMEASQAWA